jgi:transcriptional regulator GlxA family with amidase domain
MEHRFGAACTRPCPTTSHREIVQCAETYLRAHLDTPVAVSSLCRVVGRSERGLREAFYDVHGMGPKRWVLAERLKTARRALIRSDAGSITVTLVATASGFHELGRFAAMYREAFGEVPSQTLRGRTQTRRNCR